jgi:hypothetical protein
MQASTGLIEMSGGLRPFHHACWCADESQLQAWKLTVSIWFRSAAHVVLAFGPTSSSATLYTLIALVLLLVLAVAYM